MNDTSSIKLVVSDVDGTLLTPENLVTPAARVAIVRLHSHNIHFTLASSRPAQGLKRLVKELAIRVPVGALNGGVLLSADLEVIRAKVLPRFVAEQTLRTIRECGLVPWVYTAADWFVENSNARVKQEAVDLGYQAKKCSDLLSLVDTAVKIVGVHLGSQSNSGVCDEVLRLRLGQNASVHRSHSDFLDVTHPEATKGSVVNFLSEVLGITKDQVASIGDMQNDVPMFEHSGISVAMGNASPEVKGRAKFVTASNAKNGFAAAIGLFLDSNGPSVQTQRQCGGNHPTLSQNVNSNMVELNATPTT